MASSSRVQQSGARSSERRIFQRRPDRPPQMAGVLDGAGAHHRRDIFVVVAVAAEQFGQPGARQFIVGGEPITFQPGGAALPERRRGRQRDEQRQIRQHPRHHVDPARRIGKLDMDVHAAQHVALADHLQHVHDMGVAVLGRLHRLRPARRRMGAAGEDGQAVLGGGGGHVLAEPLELGSRVADLAMRLRRNLDLGLEKLAADPPRSCRTRQAGTALPASPWAPAGCAHRRGNIPPRCRTGTGRPARRCGRVPAAPGCGCGIVARCGSNLNSISVKSHFRFVGFAASTRELRFARVWSGPSG